MSELSASALNFGKEKRVFWFVVTRKGRETRTTSTIARRRMLGIEACE